MLSIRTKLPRRSIQNGSSSAVKRRVFVSEVFRFEVLGFEEVNEDFYKVYFGMLRLVSLTRKRFASGRFRS